jgi:hypothetical protein
VARPTLKVDGGAPPPPVDDVPDDADAPLEPGAVRLDDPGDVELEPGWQRETIRSLVAVPFLALHLLERRRGPADAWLPDDGELDVMAVPLYNLVVRSVRLRPLAKYGDAIAFTTATGTYVAGESRRIAIWRAEYVPGEPIAPDADVSHLFTRPTEPQPRHDAPPQPSGPPIDVDVRPWRPPNVPPE